jgi:DNA-binding NarL/FixJ family response regulator
MTTITILVVDDHPVVRDGVRAALRDSDIEVVGEATTGEDAVELAVALRPRVVLMDLGLPGISGVEATRRILAADPGIAVLAFTMHSDDESVFSALRAGALGYLVKGADKAELERGVRSVASGEAVFLRPGVARRVLAFFAAAQAPAARAPAGLRPLPQLTDREREILDLMAAGWGNQVIARKLFLAPKTVRNHVSNVIGKLQAADRGEAVVRARELGFGANPSDGARGTPA